MLVRVQREPLDVAEVDAFLRNERAGGACIFSGTTRRWTEKRETERLEYEAYDQMARDVMQRLAHSAHERWDLVRVAVIHRTGLVPVMDVSVLVGVSAPHRDDAFAACRWLIDTLKRDVPIWKKEHYADGTREWAGSPD